MQGAFGGVVQKNLRLLERFSLLFGQILDRDRQLLVGLARRTTKRMSPWSPAEEKCKPRNNAQPLRPNGSRRIRRRENADIRRRSFPT